MTPMPEPGEEGVFLETSSAEAALWRPLLSWGSERPPRSLVLLSLRSGQGGSRSLSSHEAQPLPRPDLHPWPLPHLPTVAMKTWVML